MNPSHRSSFFYLHGEILILLVLFIGAAGFAAYRFPVLNPDEIIVMVNAYSIMHGHGIRYFLNHGIYPPAIDRLGDLSNHIARPFFDALIGPWVILGHRHFQIVRLSSVMSGAIALLLFYLLGVQWQGRRLGFLFVFACLCNPVFLAACLVINEHLLLMTMGIGLLLLLDPLSKKSGWHTYLWGILSASLFFVHQNGIVLWISLFVFGILTYAKNHRFRWAMQLVTGCLSGFLLFLQSVDLPRMLLFQKAIYWTFAKPPILSWPWHPLLWIVSTGRLIVGGSTYYFFHDRSPLPGGWMSAQIVYWASLITAVVGSAFTTAKMGVKLRNFLHPLEVSAAVGIVFMALLIRRQEAFYALTLLPVVVPLFGISGERLWSSSRNIFISFAATTGFASFLFLCFAWNYSHSYPSWSSIQSQLKPLAPSDGGRILAPNVLWAEFPVESFRDISGAVTARYYIDAPLRAMLSTWKPHILITESSFRHAYGMLEHDPLTLAHLLGHPVLWQGSVDTKNAYGIWDVYLVDWTRT